MLWGPAQTLPAPAPSSLTASASGVPLPQQPAEPGGRAADAVSPGGRTSPAPPCSRPPSREEEQAGLRPDPPSHPGPGGPRTAAPRGQSQTLPRTLLHPLPPQQPLPTRSHPLLSLSAPYNPSSRKPSLFRSPIPLQISVSHILPRSLFCHLEANHTSGKAQSDAYKRKPVSEVTQLLVTELALETNSRALV